MSDFSNLAGSKTLVLFLPIPEKALILMGRLDTNVDDAHNPFTEKADADTISTVKNKKIDFIVQFLCFTTRE